MKIKTVCELTGLTARTVRVYVEEGLIAPQYTENYLGRRTFNFSEEDVFALRSIAILRKFGFSISEILKIQESKENSIPILSRLCEQKAQEIEDQRKALEALQKIDRTKAYTVAELAEKLRDVSTNAALPQQDLRFNTRAFIKQAFRYAFYAAIALCPLLFFISACLRPTRPIYATFSIRNLIFLLMTFLPSVIIACLYFSKHKKRGRGRIVRVVSIVLAILLLPISWISSLGIIGPASCTTNIAHYRKLDADCLANKSMFYQELFPIWPGYSIMEKNERGEWVETNHEVYYYYYYMRGIDYTYDIYAEWPLEKERFHTEVERVKALYAEYAVTDADTYYEHEVIQKGSYICLFRYAGGKPFERVKEAHPYEYWIFAYDEQTQRVRYIHCDGQQSGPKDQPYYLSLKW